ncbi:hypothetical protein [Brenneria rubrifaciens]|uniref:hypothetical protein n=1 Tax=Brenneria rubrifaciens TaxID=55213 RepID=UPI001585E9D7|nr:hypothetical protein [Brenneria rubrifaciens]
MPANKRTAADTGRRINHSADFLNVAAIAHIMWKSLAADRRVIVSDEAYSPPAGSSGDTLLRLEQER